MTISAGIYHQQTNDYLSTETVEILEFLRGWI